MVKMLLAGLWLACLWGSACLAAPSAVAYRIRPVIEGGALKGLAVEMRFAGDASGHTRLVEPGSNGRGEVDGHPDLQDLQVDGAVATKAADGSELLVHAPGAPIVVRYRIVSGYDQLPQSQPQRAIVTPTWFAVHGERLFVRPLGRDGASASVVVTGLPAGWIAASDLGPGSGTTVGDLDDRYLIGGAGWHEIDRPIGAASLRLFYRADGGPKSPKAGADLVARVTKAAFDYWGDPPSDVLVPVIPVNSDRGGRGIRGGFLIFTDRDGDLGSFKHTFAHEFEHSWTSRQIGGFPATDPDLEAWLNEGFTELTAARVLLHGGLWTLQDFADDLNVALLEYGTSPAIGAPNADIQQRRFTDFDVGMMPYYRGRLLGLVWERRLREASGGRVGLQDALQTQRRLARAAERAGQTTSADKLFPLAVMQVSGVDLGPDLRTFVDQGARIMLPPDLFGACGTVETVTQPVFDRGFDIYATMRNGHRLTGLEPGGPAERAGLRDGQSILIDETPSRDSQAPLTYRVVQADGSNRPVTYKPEGAGSVTFQRLRLNPKIDVAAEARCRVLLSGRA